MLASEKGNVAMVSLLLEHGAGIDLQNNVSRPLRHFTSTLLAHIGGLSYLLFTLRDCF